MAIGAIILAAGRSTRMGRPKALLQFDGRSFLAVIAAKLRFSEISSVVVVVARPDQEIASEAARAGARVAFNPDPARGMLSSVIAGLDLLEPTGVEALLLWPVDHPAVGEATPMALKMAWEKTRAPVVVPEYHGQRGHPVLFSRGVFGELRRAPETEGARALLTAHTADLVRVEVADPGVVMDIDTPEEYGKLVTGRAPDNNTDAA